MINTLKNFYKSYIFKKYTVIYAFILFISFVFNPSLEKLILISTIYITFCTFNFLIKYKYYKNLPYNPEDTNHYKIYTDEFDKVIKWSELEAFLKPIYLEDTTKFPKHFQKDTANDSNQRQTYLQNKLNYINNEAIAQYKTTLAKYIHPRFLDDTVISLVVDHSNSLRGEPLLLLVALLEQLCAFFDAAGIKYEVLGFTTSTWKGGQSRTKWIENNCPPLPGRLCDLLHIIYKELDDYRQPLDFSHLVENSYFLKENVDGEALLWAHDRLKLRNETYKLIIPISDGAPVDDSTLAANNPYSDQSNSYLNAHKNAAIHSILKYKNTSLAPIIIGGNFHYTNRTASFKYALLSDINPLLTSFIPQALHNLYANKGRMNFQDKHVSSILN